MQNIGLSTVREQRRFHAPVPQPQALAYHEGAFWLSSRGVPTMYRVDAATWEVRQSVAAPGSVWGLAASAAGLAAVCGIGSDDDRYLYRYTFEDGFSGHGVACPDFTGSYVAYDAALQLHLTQWYNRRIIALDDGGNERQNFEAPHGICGICLARETFYVLGTDDEASNEYVLSRLTIEGSGYRIEDVAQVPFAGRSLVFDGERFWSNHREQNQVVAFDLPTA